MININTCALKTKGKFIELQISSEESTSFFTGLCLYTAFTFGQKRKALDLSHLLEGTSNTEILMIDLNELGLNGIDLFFIEATNSDSEVATGITGNFSDIVLQNLEDLLSLSTDEKCETICNAQVDEILYDHTLISNLHLLLCLKEYKTVQAAYTYLKNKTIFTSKCTEALDEFTIYTESNNIINSTIMGGGKNCGCGSNSSGSSAELKNLQKAVNELKVEVAQLKIQVGLCCDGERPDPEPEPELVTITNFKLNVNNVVGAQTLSLSSATFNTTGGSEIKANSLKIIFENSGATIASGLPNNSPVSFGPLQQIVSEGNTYRWKASIEDTEGNVYYSNTYSITCSAEPIVAGNTMYIGHTDTPPTVFQGLTIEQIFALDDNREKRITGTADNTFTINQEKSIHYLLIPSTTVDLIKSEYGTSLITTLWDINNTAGSSYFTTNQGGVYQGVNYKVYFSYSPIGAFAEEIRVTCRNK